jgi:cytochrome P450
VHAVFKDSNLHLKAKNSNQGWLCGEILEHCVGLLNLDNWTRVRAIFVETFHQSKSISYVPLIQRRIQGHFQILKRTNQFTPKRMHVRPADDLKFLPFWIVCDIIYGDLTETMEMQLLQIFPLRDRIGREVTRGGFSRFSISRFFPTSLNHTLREFKKKWRDFNDQTYQEAQIAALGSRHPIISMYAAVEDGRISKTELLHTLDELTFDNLDVITANLGWILVFLAANSSTQEEVRAEITKIRNTGSPDAWANYLSGSSTLLMACVLESTRLKPTAPVSINQAITTDRIIDHFLIPAGTNFLVDTHALNVADPYWGEDSTIYRPKRFLEGRRMASMRYHFFRYGFGPRQCLGKNVADLFLKATVAYLVENYRLDLAKGISHIPDEWESKANNFFNLPAQEIVCTEL